MDESQNAPSIWTTFALFYNGEFISHEMQGPKGCHRRNLAFDQEFISHEMQGPKGFDNIVKKLISR